MSIGLAAPLCAAARIRLGQPLVLAWRAAPDADLAAAAQLMAPIRQAGLSAPLAVAAPAAALCADAAAARGFTRRLDALGLSPQAVMLDIEEEDLARAPALTAAQLWRAEGFRLALRASDAPRLPLDRTLRALFCELICPVENLSTPAAGDPRRLAARAAGLRVTARANAGARLSSLANSGCDAVETPLASLPARGAGRA